MVLYILVSTASLSPEKGSLMSSPIVTAVPASGRRTNHSGTAAKKTMDGDKAFAECLLSITKCLHSLKQPKQVGVPDMYRWML